MDDERAQISPVKCWSIVVLVVLCVMFAYVLSIGPAAWLQEHGYIAIPYSRYFYAPVIWLGTRNLLTLRIYVWYMNLWGVDSSWYMGIRA